MSDTVKCSVCGSYRNKFRPRKSALQPTLTLYLCTTCFEGGFEPRWLVILTGRQFGIEKVQKYLIPKRYHGNEIPASDLINV